MMLSEKNRIFLFAGNTALIGLGLTVPTSGTVQYQQIAGGINRDTLTVPLFRKEVTSYAVRIPDWRYPVEFDVEQFPVLYHNFEGRRGEPFHFNRLLQYFGVVKCHL